MKKSKVIIPALGVLILSTAASVTGTVAWFTANRTATITAGEFAVVKTADDLSVTLGSGIGTTATNPVAPATPYITVNSGYKLTDASFDHTAYSAPILPVVTPNVPRTKVLKNTALASISAEEMLRGTNTYSAFTWTMTFTVSFSESASKKQGLFIDLSDAATYMHEKVTFTAAQAAAIEGTTGLYTNEACTTAADAAEHPAADTTYYRLAPDHTGKAFRIAFVPTAITTSGAACMGYTKVWADNEGSAEGEGKFVDGVAAGNDLNAVAYGTATTSYNGTAFAEAAAGSGKVLMKSGDNSGIPDDGTLSSTTALSGNSNYLGYFAADPGKNVSITYTCVAWYDGTHPEIVGTATDFERVVASMKFGVAEFTD